MADEVPEASKIRLDKGEAAGEGAGSEAPAAPVAPPAPEAPPSVHDQRTIAAVPGPGAPADAPPQGWANPFAAPSGTVPAPPVNPFAAPGPNGPPNPYAPPAGQQPQSAAVPPPPIAPNGPGPVPYGYPGQYPGQALPAYPAGPGGYGGYGGWPGMQPVPNNGLGTAAMVTGIISAIGFCMVPVAFVMGVLAIVFGVIGRRRVRRGEATNGGQALAGIICGSAGLVIIAAFVTLIVVAGSQGSQ